MSSATTTSSTSRSPSPSTPGSTSDTAEPVVVQSSEQNWFYSLKQPSLWDIEQTIYNNAKSEDPIEMLGLDDLLERHVFEDATAAAVEPVIEASPLLHNEQSQLIPDFFPTNLLVPSRNGPVSLHKPSPSIPSYSRKQEVRVANLKVVKPLKESCYNLPIVFPSMPEGTKSRVETQIRLTIDLADTSSSSDPTKYDRVGSWNWLKLPEGTTTKRKPRKQAKTEPNPNDVLHLSVNVTCASPPHNPVLCCSSCQNREAKRVAKKIASRVKPQPESDSDNGNRPSKSKKHEDTTSIIHFNCADSVDFSAGSVVLPLRLTCYCRHHREKVGFIVHFTMMDHSGRIVGTGSTKPIMITDDHKTTLGTKQTDLLGSLPGVDPTNWPQTIEPPEVNAFETTAPSKRKKDVTPKSRVKPYDSAAKTKRIVSRETSVSSSSPLSSHLSLTRSPTPPASAVPPLHYSSQDSESSSDVPTTVDVPMDSELSPMSLQTISSHPHPMPFMFIDSVQASQPSASIPTIHRLIPNMGPTHGGIEVTVLGANFHPSVPLSCVFGGVPASSTQRWSDNALVCVLPPRATAGVVSVWFEGFPKTEDQGSPPTLFTYSDESDRALMELALQVVGLKMTGKIEDAKNVAMRIVGGDSNDSQRTVSVDNMMQLATSTRDLRPLLLRGNENESFETMIVKFLSIVHTPVEAPHSISMSKAASHQTPSGQTLLHLASLMGFATIVKFLVEHRIDLDARDRNGFTPLHFAAFSRSTECAKILLQAGADREVVNSFGKTPEEIASDGFFDDLLDFALESGPEDEEAHWGDGEEDARVSVKRTVSRKPSRRLTISRAPTPPPAPPPPSEKKIPVGGVDEKQNAWFVEMIQRTLAQLPAAPQLPLPDLRNLPHLPQLPGMPAVPWGALPQLPVVFPVFVPMMPNWPSFLGGDASAGDGKEAEAAGGVRTAAIRLAQEQWRNAWEKWMALATPQQTEPPPMYTPRASEKEDPTEAQAEPATAPVEEPPIPSDSRHIIRRMGYGVAPAVSKQEVDSFSYQPRTQQKKQDRMLTFFWLPVLFLSLLWALHNGVKFVYQTIPTALSLKTVLRS